MKGKNFISDEEMSKLEASPSTPNFISDTDMVNMEMAARKQPAPDSGGAGQAALEHYGNTATLGYLPHIQAIVEGATPSPSADVDAELRAKGFTLPGDPGYVAARDANIKRLEELKQAHPTAAKIGMGAGIVGNAVLTSAVAPVARAATLGGRLLQGAKVGGAMGAVANPGDTQGEYDPVQFGARAKGAVVGAGLGAAGSAAVEGIAAGAGAAARQAKALAETKAFKATGAMLRDFRKAYGKDKVREIGRELLDGDIVTPLATPKDVAARTAVAREAKAQQIETILGELDEAANKAATSGEPGLVPAGTQATQGAGRVGVDRKAIAKSMRDELISADTDIPGIAAKNAKIDKLITEFEEGGGELIGLLKSELKKRSVGKEINWDRLKGADIPIEEQVQRALYTKLKQGVESGAEALEQAVGGPNAGRFVKAKNSYGNLDTANKIATDRVARDASNRAFGLTDTIGGGAGATVGALLGGPAGAAVGTAVGAGVNKLGRTYGNALMATGFDKAANASAAIARGAANASPVAVQGTVAATNAAARGAGRTLAPNAGDDSLLRNPQLIEYFKANPSQVDVLLSDPKSREQMKAKLGTTSAGEATKGPERWASRGLEKLGITDESRRAQLLASKEGKRLLIEASDLPDGSKALQRIKEQIERVTHGTRTAPVAEVLRLERKPARGR